MKICIIGDEGHTGYVLEALKRDPDLRIAGIAPGDETEDITKLQNKINKIGQEPAVYKDYIKMLDREKPDIAVAATLFYKQAQLAVDVLDRDINVFVEKPIATTMDELNKVKDVYQNSNAQLAAMFGIRYKPWFMTAWKLVQGGIIGKVRLMNAQKSYKLGKRADFYKKRVTYGGTIPWVGSHAIDWLYWFSGKKFENVYALQSSKYNRDHGELEVTAQLQFAMTDGVMGAVNIDYLRPDTAPTHDDDRLRIAGSEGVIEVSGGKVFLINANKDGVQEISLEANEGIFTDFVRQLRGEGECLVSADDSFYITEACLKARQSADEKKVVYF